MMKKTAGEEPLRRCRPTMEYGVVTKESFNVIIVTGLLDGHPLQQYWEDNKSLFQFHRNGCFPKPAEFCAIPVVIWSQKESAELFFFIMSIFQFSQETNECKM